MDNIQKGSFRWSDLVIGFNSKKQYEKNHPYSLKELYNVNDFRDLSSSGAIIDYVDTEWCLRCRSKGIPVRVVPSAIMHHRIGTNTTKIGPLTVQIHSADRCYYQIRNSFHLFRRRHIPFIFALKEVISTIVNRVLLLFLVENRVLYAKAYLRAIMDGLLGVVGPKTT